MTDPNLANRSDSELAAEIANLTHEIDSLYTQIAMYSALRANMEAEQERRRLMPFWEAHPGLSFVTGDLLLVTQTVIDSPECEMFKICKLGETFYASNIGGEYKPELIYILRSSGGMGVPVSIELARHMRQAWLEQQAAKP